MRFGCKRQTGHDRASPCIKQAACGSESRDSSRINCFDVAFASRSICSALRLDDAYILFLFRLDDAVEKTDL